MNRHSISNILAPVAHRFGRSNNKRERSMSDDSACSVGEARPLPSTAPAPGSPDSALGAFTPRMAVDSPPLTSGLAAQAMCSSDSGVDAPVAAAASAADSWRYTQHRLVQRGSTAAVYVAADIVSLEQVAIKRMAVNDKSRILVNREVQLQQHVSGHPNIATVYGAFESADSIVNIAMEYMPGGDLIDRVTKQGGLPADTVLDYTYQLASALQWMHTLGVAHRDIKCENVCIAKDGSLRLIDFGQAHRIGQDAAPCSRQAGTRNYMAPECWAKENALLVLPDGVPMAALAEHMDLCAADAWSLGVLLYCLCTARFPWAQATLCNADFALFASGGLSDQLAARWVHIPRAIRTIIKHLLVVDPRQRWSMADVCTYIESLHA